MSLFGSKPIILIKNLKKYLEENNNERNKKAKIYEDFIFGKKEKKK